MNQVKLKEFIKDKSIVVPGFLLRQYQKLNLELDEFVMLLFLLDKDGQVFNPNILDEYFHFDLMKTMDIISNLTEKGILNLATKKNDSGLMEEIIDLEPLWSKLTMDLVNDLNTVNIDELNIHSLVEEEFNRKLTSLEHEMIDDWEKNNYSKELIREAIKEASLNGITTLRYIDKILIDWTRAGIKRISDIPKKNEKKEEPEIVIGDWLNYDDDEI